MRKFYDGFYMVYGEGQGAPTVRHQTFEIAQAEARRLAAKMPGVRFFVLVALGHMQKADPVTYTQFETPDDMITF